MIDGVIEFLSGETRTIVRELERKMREAAAEERYEEAARYRNRLFAIESLAERQGADRRAVGTIDVIGLASDGDRAAVQLFPLRDGRLIDRYAFHLENVEGQDRATILESFCLEYYTAAPSVPPQVIVPADIGDTEALAAVPLRAARSAVEVRAPARGEKRRLAELADENARLALDARGDSVGAEAAAQDRGAGEPAGVPQPRKPSGADRVLRHLEHPGTRHRRVDDGVRRRRSRRRRTTGRSPSRAGGSGRFRVDGAGRRAPVCPASRCGDPDAMTRASRAMPNLIVIDGGKGQLAAALEAIHSTYDVPRVAVIALAKREEEVFVPGRPVRSCSSGTIPGCSCCSGSATRRTGLRSRYHRQRRDTRGVRVDLRHARRHRPGAAAGDPAPLRLGRRVPGRLAGGARGRAGAAGEDGAGRLRAAAQDGRRGERRERLDATGAGSAPTGRLARRNRTVLECQEDRGEADDGVHDGERELHADAEGQQRRARLPGRAGCRAGAPARCRCRPG